MRVLIRSAWICLLSTVVLLTFASVPTRADADEPVNGSACSSGVVCVDTQDAGTPGKPQRPSSVAPSPCRFGGRSVPCQLNGGAFEASSGCYAAPVEHLPDSGPVRAEYDQFGGSILWLDCPYDPWAAGGFVWRAPVRPQVTAGLVRARAERLVPVAAVGLAPRASTLVNIQTVMWVDAAPEVDLPVVQLLGRQVRIHLVRESVAWGFGDGQLLGDGPAGSAYDSSLRPCRTRLCEGYFGHVYARTGAVTVSAQVAWRASFTVDSGRVQQIGQLVSGPVARAGLRVREARAVLVPNPGEH